MSFCAARTPALFPFAKPRFSFSARIRTSGKRFLRNSSEPSVLPLSTTRYRPTFDNRERMDLALKSLQKRLAFRYVRGLSERVIYRELFPKGLTLADLKDIDEGPRLSMSHVAARHELRSLLNDLALPGLSG